MQRGFTIYFAVLVASLSIAVGLTIYDLLSRELTLSQTATQSQYAIYAADTGIECALYWDFNAPELNGIPSAFGTSSASSWPASGSGINCTGQDISTLWGTPTKNSSAATTSFTINLAGSSVGPCVIVDVAKSGGVNAPRTVVSAYGRNTCAGAGALRVERTLQVNY